MRLATFKRADGVSAIGAVGKQGDVIVDLQVAQARRRGAMHPAFRDMLTLMAGGVAALDDARELEAWAGSRPDGEAVKWLEDVSLLSPVPVPAQIRDFSSFERHMKGAAAAIARERARKADATACAPDPEGIRVPEVSYRQPIYKGNRFSVVGHDEDVRWPTFSNLFDYELEFGVFIGARGCDVAARQAGKHIFGFVIFNDFSARDAQAQEMSAPMGPAKGKDFDTGNAIGPWIVTPDEIADPYNLMMTATINGVEWSRGRSSDMLHSFEEMIAHVSRDETLHPGEFFGSGTVGGGCGLELDRWLQPGDVVELAVDGLGTLRNRVVRAAGPVKR